MGIFTGLFKSRDKPQNSYDSPSYSYFFGRTQAGKRVNDRTLSAKKQAAGNASYIYDWGNEKKGFSERLYSKKPLDSMYFDGWY